MTASESALTQNVSVDMVLTLITNRFQARNSMHLAQNVIASVFNSFQDGQRRLDSGGWSGEKVLM